LLHIAFSPDAQGDIPRAQTEGNLVLRLGLGSEKTYSVDTTQEIGSRGATQHLQLRVTCTYTLQCNRWNMYSSSE
jgi:hypothetical protein